jgi:hypothetical protein
LIADAHHRAGEATGVDIKLVSEAIEEIEKLRIENEKLQTQ